MKKIPQKIKKQDFFGFKDQATNYAKFRPNYPQQFISQILQNKDVKNIPKNECLDIATGTGFVAYKLSKEFKKAVGIDISEEQLKQAQQQYKDVQNLTFVQCSIEDYLKKHIQNKKNEINLITIAQALHWFDNIPEVLKNIHQIMGDNSRLVIITYLQQDIYLNKKQIINQRNILLNKGFDVQDNSDSLQHESFDQDLLILKQFYDQFFDLIKPYFKFDRTIIDRYYEPLQLEKHLNIRNKISYIDCYECPNLIGYLKSVSGYNCYLKDKNIQKGTSEDPLQKINDQFEKMGQPRITMITTYLAFIASRQLTLNIIKTLSKLRFLLKNKDIQIHLYVSYLKKQNHFNNK